MFRSLREKTGMTQAQTARKLRINPGFWSRIESGHVELPPKHYVKTSKLLNVPVAKIVDFRVKKFKTGLVKEVSKCLRKRSH